MEPFFLENEQYFLINDWLNGAVAGFTTKNGGHSKNQFDSLNLGFHVNDEYEDVCRNRHVVSELLKLPLESWVGAEQTHEISIAKVGKEHRGQGSVDYGSSLKAIDGFFTKETDILLTLCYADCVPLYFNAPNDSAIGIAHAGWKGTVKGIGNEMIRTFLEEGIQAKDILVVIGPSICENCYIVDNKVIDMLKNVLEDVEQKPYNLISGNQYHLNLKELNRQILIQSGVRDDKIQISNLCTSCDKEHFFSHRRDKGSTGRMMGFISL